ncbi:MAG: tRNA pseudouridine(38-40) synthase TruA, partial [Kitasatospora sp.]|jgi:tRNA pseudouridine38-40 synthase|nr:tRNA pseudouridine(38-40) synthase TruA [Kitasatospora sp.]
VQGELEDALRIVLRSEANFPLSVAGRPDAGVPARGQVAHVDLPDALWAPHGATLLRGHVLWHDRPLDLEKMNEAAALLVGEHDFAAYCKKREGATTIRTLLELHWDRVPIDPYAAQEGSLAVATVRADAFCHNMVRALVGAMLLVGDGHRPVEFPGEVLAGGVRNSAVNVIRPHGLTLEEVGYPADELLAERNRISRRLRTLGEPAPADAPGR